MTTQDTLGIIAYAPALLGNDRRTLAAVQGLERALPGVRLEWGLSEQGVPIALPQRDEWLAEAAARGEFPLLCNGDESHAVTISGHGNPAHLSPGGQALFQIHAELPLDTTGIATTAVVLEEIAEGMRVFWGHATPLSAGVEIARQTTDPVRKPQVPPRGLPALKFPDRISSPAIPHRLGWMNYWSAATARVLGFPNPSRDVDLLSRARRTATGGWVIRLTEAPLDLDNPSHLDTLLRTYERFPQVGGRSTP
jgi:uncharacterized protein DUF5953